MGYGLLLDNKKGKRLYQTGETAMLFYGYKTATMTYSMNKVTINCFNIKKAWGWKVAVFVGIDDMRSVIESTGETAYCKMLYDSSGTLTVEHFNSTRGSGYSTYIRVYVFIDAKHVPLTQWGMALYDDAGRPVFHTSRPPLKLDYVQPPSNLGSSTSRKLPSNLRKPALLGLRTPAGESYHKSPYSEDGDVYHHYLMVGTLRRDGAAVPTLFTVEEYGHQDWYDEEHFWGYDFGALPIIDGAQYEVYGSLPDF